MAREAQTAEQERAWQGAADVGARGVGGGRAGRAAWAWPGRWMGVLAGSTGPSWCTVHLAQF